MRHVVGGAPECCMAPDRDAFSKGYAALTELGVAKAGLSVWYALNLPHPGALGFQHYALPEPKPISSDLSDNDKVLHLVTLYNTACTQLLGKIDKRAKCKIYG